MDEIGLSELMQLIIRDKGGTPQQYNQLMDYIAYHETGPEQRMDPKAKQISGNEKEGFYDGPGRGLFMFEVGEKKGGNTAVNRTVKYFKDNNLPLPKWLYDLSMGSKESKSVDVSSLSADQQKMLFLGNHREHPNSNFSNIWTGQQAISDFWLKNHWSGDPDDSVIKLDLFNKNMLAKDSTDALKVREEELMYKQNMAPYLSDSNNINNLPTEKNILDSIFGAQDSSLIKEYSHGGVHLPVAEPDATYVQQPQFNIPIAQEEQYVDQFGSTGGSFYNPLIGNNPYNQWISGASNQMYASPKQKQASQDYAQNWLGLATPIPILEGINLTSKGARVPGLIDDAILSSLVKGYKGIKGVVADKVKIGTVVSSKTGKTIDEFTKFKPTPQMVESMQDVLNKRVQYVTSDKYLKLRQANTGESIEQIKNSVERYIKELNKTTVVFKPKGETIAKTTKGQYNKNQIDIAFPKHSIDELPADWLETFDHETLHLLSPIGKKHVDMPAQYITKDGKEVFNPAYKEYILGGGPRVEGGTTTIVKGGELVKDKWVGAYKDYPKIEVSHRYKKTNNEVYGPDGFYGYLMNPAEQQVRFVRAGEYLTTKYGWDGTSKGLTDDMLENFYKDLQIGGSSVHTDYSQIFRMMEGIKTGSKEWKSKIRKVLPHAWGMAPVAATTLQE
jgi:hypothetical protein